MHALVRVGSLVVISLLLTGCGKVIPAIGPSPTENPTITPESEATFIEAENSMK